MTARVVQRRRPVAPSGQGFTQTETTIHEGRMDLFLTSYRGGHSDWPIDLNVGDFSLLIPLQTAKELLANLAKAVASVDAARLKAPDWVQEETARAEAHHGAQLAAARRASL